MPTHSIAATGTAPTGGMVEFKFVLQDPELDSVTVRHVTMETFSERTEMDLRAEIPTGGEFQIQTRLAMGGPIKVELYHTGHAQAVGVTVTTIAP